MTLFFRNIDFNKGMDEFLRFRKEADKEIIGEFNNDQEKIKNYIDRCLANIGPDAFLHVYEDDNLIGQIEIGQKENFGYIHLFYLLPIYRGKGYFRLMHAKAMEIFLSRGINHIQLATTPGNKHAIKIYEKYGWINMGPCINKPDMVTLEFKIDTLSPTF